MAYEPGRDPVRIDDLVSPLRYDVLVRERYFGFLRDHRALAGDDFAAFMALSRDQEYYRWFKGVAIPEFRPEWGGDPEGVDRSFKRRLRRLLATYDDLERNGYDPRRPVLLRAGDEIGPTDTGKQVASHLHAGDGCHRLAWLRHSGVAELAPGTYRVQRTRRFVPRDITHKVLEALEVTPGEYFSFLQLAYGGHGIDSQEMLLAHIGKEAPDRLEEVRGVLASDLPLLAG